MCLKSKISVFWIFKYRKIKWHTHKKKYYSVTVNTLLCSTRTTRSARTIFPSSYNTNCRDSLMMTCRSCLHQNPLSPPQGSSEGQVEAPWVLRNKGKNTKWLKFWERERLMGMWAYFERTLVWGAPPLLMKERKIRGKRSVNQMFLSKRVKRQVWKSVNKAINVTASMEMRKENATTN